MSLSKPPWDLEIKGQGRIRRIRHRSGIKGYLSRSDGVAKSGRERGASKKEETKEEQETLPRKITNLKMKGKGEWLLAFLGIDPQHN